MSNRTFTHTKDTAVVYRLRDGSTWGDFVLDETEPGKGQILINSDYGAWSYYWGAMGKGMKQFLVNCDEHYLMGKFGGARQWFDSEATKDRFRDALKDMLNSDDIDIETYETLCEEIDDSDFNTPDSTYWRFSEKMSEVFPEPFDMFVNDHEPDLRNFMKRIWPAFIDVLKTEIEQEVK